ncbi:MAG: tetratricopeptide repeat protein [Polyangiaceae bacterium]
MHPFVAFVVAIFTATSGLPRVARADTPPTAWDFVGRPEARRAWLLHLTVRERIEFDRNQEVRSLRAASLEQARALIEGAKELLDVDVRLRFDLGEIYEALGMHEPAIAALTRAIHDAPSHPSVGDAWVTLAYAYAKMDRAKDERDAYVEYLEYVTDDRSRATAVLNLAEAHMHLGEMTDAVRQYREAVSIGASLPNSIGTAETMALAVWGLAVALDRSGDAPAALTEAARATKLDPGEAIIGHSPNVFFVPSYERLWYLGLAATVHARETTDGKKRAAAWQAVEATWTQYLLHADPDDRWRRLAETHRDRARRMKVR